METNIKQYIIRAIQQAVTTRVNSINEAFPFDAEKRTNDERKAENEALILVDNMIPNYATFQFSAKKEE